MTEIWLRSRRKLTAFVVRNDSGIKSTKDFADKKFATPQVRSTQAVALRRYLLQNEYRLKMKGGTVEVISAQVSDIYTLMLSKQIDDKSSWIIYPQPTSYIIYSSSNHTEETTTS
jgi:NitT/TauT family transport system substrate-binding protein